VLSQLIVGARLAVIGPLCVAAGCLLIGCSLGIMAAYFGGAVDSVIGRFADLVYALPALLIAIVILGTVGGGYWLTVAVLTLLSVPYEIRLCRSAAMVQVRQPYIDAARTLGLSSQNIMRRHVLPNILPTVVATCLLDFVGALIGFTALQFLGFGVQPGSADWGTMISSGQGLITLNPWLCIAPALLLIATAASVTLIGDWAYDRIALRVTTA
jgi:ABC-type dipeptide/oligopeptide/nickel transport system permease subunit